MVSHANGNSAKEYPRDSGSDDSKSQGTKRRHSESTTDSPEAGMGQTQSTLRQPDLPEFSLTSARTHSRDGISPQQDRKRGSEEGQAENDRAKKKAKKIPRPESSNYPAIEFSEKSCRLAGQIKISDLQNLVLYVLTDAPSPQFVSIRHRPQIRKVVVLMVPGLEKYDFLPGTKKEQPKRDRNGQLSPDEYYPMTLKSEDLPEGLQAFAEMFPHLWPVRTPGDDRFYKMHSPLYAMLTAPVERSKEDKKWTKSKGNAQPAKEPKGWKNSRTPITEYIHTPEELLENDYTLHPAIYSDREEKVILADFRQSNGVSVEHGWVDTKVKSFEEGTPPDNEIESGSLTAGRQVLAMDCEMCMTGDNEFSLTRISLVGWDGSVVLDELVKPEKPIVDYVTQYSGITEAMLVPITTTLADIQKTLLDILSPRSILIGHSLNSDLTALKITHPFIIDTALIFPHPRGPPLKSSLKYLAQKYLSRQIQKGHGTTGPGAGHDSIEDARTCLDLVKQKCEKGKEWGTGDSQGENIFRRVARAGVKYKSQGGSAIPSPMDGKTSAAIDWGDPKKGPGAAASHIIGCKSDEEVKNGIIRAVNGDHDGLEIPGGGVDFVWGRFRELEALKGWWNDNKSQNAQAIAREATNPDLDANLVDLSNGTGGATEASDIQEKDAEVDVAASESEVEPKAVITAITNTALPPPSIDPSTSLSTALSDLTKHIAAIHASLPPCTALILYSGSGDPREMSRLQSLQAQFKREYKIRKWDDLTVKWTDAEEQALKKAVTVARNGVGFITMK